ncbi:hypothetical protein GCM10025856_19880 [Methylophaga marina]|uniref:Uncharacterized protein n=1 Tax=Methylophaga marina TaxID=45495 RepID=A0ABP3CW14_9GAMM|nr:hypothetical protein GCM10025856_19880 [Methylophaga marina]
MDNRPPTKVKTKNIAVSIDDACVFSAMPVATPMVIADNIMANRCPDDFDSEKLIASGTHVELFSTVDVWL